MTDSALPTYFRRVHRRAQHRSAVNEQLVARQSVGPTRGSKRYQQLHLSYSSLAVQSQAVLRRTPAVVKTTAVSSLATELAALKAEQDKRNAPKWWAGFAAHPVRSAIAAILLVMLSGVLAIGGPIAIRSYQAYQNIFDTPVPDRGGGIEVGLNPEGTAVILDLNPTQEAAVAPWDGESRVTILLMGVDRRDNEASRSDTIILINIDPVARTARMISIPRDLGVFIPGKGFSKINAAYPMGESDDSVAGGGPGLTMRTIEANFGIDINYYAEVDFDGFVNIIDTLGGVTLDVPYPIKDNEYPGPDSQYMRIYFPSGWQHMNGERVLQYARTRHDDSDLHRSARQQQVLMALRQQAVTLDLDLLGMVPDLIRDAGNTFHTDLNLEQTIQLARLGMEIAPADIEQLSLDPALIATTIDEEYYFAADWTLVGDIMSSLTGSTVIPPNSAINDPRLDTQISILDGTFNPGLGDRVLQVIQANGFADSSSADLVDLGNYPETKIIVSQEDLPTGFFLARLLGVPDSAVQVSDDPEAPTQGPVQSPTAQIVTASTPESFDITVQAAFPTIEGGDQSNEDLGPAGTIIIMIGDDLPDPAWFYVEPAD